MAKQGTFGVNTYRDRTRKKIGRHKKNLNKREKPYKKYHGQGRWQNLQVYKINLQKFPLFTSNTNIFIASLWIVNYVNNMDPLFPESNCVVHEDDVDWGGQEYPDSDNDEEVDEDNTSWQLSHKFLYSTKNEKKDNTNH